MAIPRALNRSVLLGATFVCGFSSFGLVACGSDGGSDGAGTNATSSTGGSSPSTRATTSGGGTNRTDTLGRGGAAVTSSAAGIGGNRNATGGSGASEAANGGTATSGGTAASSTSQATAIGGKAASGGTRSSAEGGATGGKSSSATSANGGAATGGKSSSTSTANGGASVGGKSASGGSSNSSAAPGGAASGGKSTSGGTSGSSAPGGATATGGAATGGSSAGTAPALSCDSALPAYTTSTTVSATITITGTKDYGMQRFCADPSALGKGDQSENQKPIFLLAKGAVLKNVIIGGSGCSAADGIHCESGSCTLENVWIGDVGEDAISFKGNDPNQVMTINGGGAFEADDKVIQHNGPGKILINGFFVKNAGKLYRSCGNCGTQYDRHIELTNVYASGIKSTLVGINYNLGDTATIHSLTRCGTVKTVCETFTGNDTGDEPTAKDSYTTSGDGKYCIYTAANILK
jgi:hypothetical protein